MAQPEKDSRSDLVNRLKWLIFFRALFAALLLGSTVMLQVSRERPTDAPSLGVIYWLIGAIFFLSVVYFLYYHRIRRTLLFTYVQIGVDTLIVTFIIYLTGGFSSLFSFLYLVVIIYASMFLPRHGIMIVAACCSIQYGVIVDVEYFGLLPPMGFEESTIARDFSWYYIIYKVAVIILACFTVAFLSGVLSEQERKTKKELQAMEDHFRRVKKLAAAGELAAGLAHEIKNPLASLRGAVQLMSHDNNDPATRKLMDIVLREADRLSALVSDFLLFAKPPSGKVQKIELSRALNDVIDLFETDETVNGVSVRRRFTPDLWIEMDPDHFRQVVWNLLLNAAEAVADGGVIEIGVHALKHKFIVLNVSDTGVGMSEETIRSIFDPFVTTKPHGTGLGLSIVHRILETYDIRLDVESEPGRGSAFSLNFRRADPPST